MKKMKKLFAVPLALTMVLGMSTTAFAAKPDNADKADVSITNIVGNPDVTLYQIASVEYGPGGVEFVDYNWAAGAEFDDPKAPTANEINEIAQGLIASPQAITPIATWTAQDVAATYTQEVPAGAYIAVITGAAPVTGKTEKNKNGQKRVYREGDSVEGGLFVQTIHADHVVLIRGSEKQILQLHKKQEKKP